MIPTTNYTEYGIHNTGERCFWIIYLLIVLLSSLIGDTVILIASIKYNAIKLNKFLVTIMQHIAVCDILTSLSFVLPTMISLIANRWVLGEVLAYFNVYFQYYSTQGGTLLICTLTCSKFLILSYPLRKTFWTKKHAHLICSITWITAHIFPVLRFVYDKNGLLFGYRSYNVNYGRPSEYSYRERLLIYLSVALTNIVPVLLVVVSTCGTLVYLVRARMVGVRSGRGRRWQGMVTVVMTGIVFCISIIPDTISFVVVTATGVSSDRFNEVLRVSEFLTALNVMSNFYIYSLAIPSFRTFIETNLKQFSRSLLRVVLSCKKFPVADLEQSP